MMGKQRKTNGEVFHDRETTKSKYLPRADSQEKYANAISIGSSHMSAPARVGGPTLPAEDVKFPNRPFLEYSPSQAGVGISNIDIQADFIITAKWQPDSKKALMTLGEIRDWVKPLNNNSTLLSSITLSGLRTLFTQEICQAEDQVGKIENATEKGHEIRDSAGLQNAIRLARLQNRRSLDVLVHKKASPGFMSRIFSLLVDIGSPLPSASRDSVRETSCYEANTRLGAKRRYDQTECLGEDLGENQSGLDGDAPMLDAEDLPVSLLGVDQQRSIRQEASDSDSNARFPSNEDRPVKRTRLTVKQEVGYSHKRDSITPSSPDIPPPTQQTATAEAQQSAADEAKWSAAAEAQLQAEFQASLRYDSEYGKVAKGKLQVVGGEMNEKQEDGVDAAKGDNGELDPKARTHNILPKIEHTATEHMGSYNDDKTR